MEKLLSNFWKYYVVTGVIGGLIHMHEKDENEEACYKFGDGFVSGFIDVPLSISSGFLRLFDESVIPQIKLIKEKVQKVDNELNEEIDEFVE